MEKRIKNRISKNVNPIKVSNRVKNTEAKKGGMFDRVKDSFNSLEKVDGVEFHFKGDEKGIDVLIEVTKWDMGILALIEASVLIYLILVLTGIPVNFSFKFDESLSNIQDNIKKVTEKIKVRLQEEVKTPDDLSRIITEEFDVLYKKDKVEIKVFCQSNFDLLKGYLEEKPDIPIKINKRNKRKKKI